MKILFVSTNVYLPQYYGGLEVSLDQLCRGLLKKGHKVAVLAAIHRRGLFGWSTCIKMKINALFDAHKTAKDTSYGYPIWRTWFPTEEVEYIVDREQADIIVIMGGTIVPATLAAKQTGLPVLVQVHDVEFDRHKGNFADLGNISCIANSRFTAERYRYAFGVESTVIYCFFPKESYKTTTTQKNIVFINLSFHKGLAIALEIARLCPDIPFSFIGSGWSLQNKRGEELTKKLAAYSNITVLAPQKDMRKIYGHCKILLAPSILEEAFGRVASEAQISGIPVIASNRGGLPEAVGPGGTLIDPEGPIEDWVKAVRQLWDDDRYYAELSAKALAHAQRPEMSFEYQIEAHEKALIAAANNKNKG